MPFTERLTPLCNALQGSAMAAGAKQTCYEGSAVQRFQFFLEQSGEHEAVLQSVRRLLPGEFKRCTEGGWSVTLRSLLKSSSPSFLLDCAPRRSREVTSALSLSFCAFRKEWDCVAA